MYESIKEDFVAIIGPSNLMTSHYDIPPLSGTPF